MIILIVDTLNRFSYENEKESILKIQQFIQTLNLFKSLTSQKSRTYGQGNKGRRN